MKFDWDEANREHIARHGVSPGEAEYVLGNDPVELGQAERNRETRTVVIGETARGRVLLVVTTLRRGRVRVVTAYPAHQTQRALYKRMRGAK